MIWPAAVLVANALFGAAAPAGASGDRLAELNGAWTCRSEYGYPGSVTAGPDGDAVVVIDETRYPSTTVTRRDRFRRDAAGGGWRAESDDDYGFAGNGPAWSGASWRLDGVMRSRRTGASAEAHLLYELRSDGLLRVSRWASNPSSGRHAALCRRGGAPPDPAVCVVADLPAVALTAGDPDVPWPGAESGTVQVLVSLDADSKIVSTRIVSSPSVLLSASAVSVARRSTFHTALRNCRPVASTYLLAVDFNDR